MLKSQIQKLDLLCERNKIVASDWEMFIKPLDVSPWIAMSVFQKAIRRGETGLALRAAATLRESDPQRLMRRLCLTAFTVAGGGNVVLLEIMIAMITNKPRRRIRKGDWTPIKKAILISSKSLKCRMVVKLHPRVTPF